MPYRQPFPIPSVIDPPRQCLCIEIPSTPEHKQVFAGLLWELTQWFNWQRDSENSGRQLAAVYRNVFNSIDWSDMSCCCDPTKVITYRVDPSSARLQMSTDDGVTWVQNPADPFIQAPALPAPVPAGISSTKCNAAANGLAHFHDTKDAHDTAFDTAGSVTEFILACAAALLAIVLAPESVPIIVPILIAAYTAVFSIGKDAFDAYFTSDVYSKILCILYCNIGDDGSFSEAGYQQVLIDIGTKLPAGIPRDMLYRDVQAWGLTGLNNICAYGTDTLADCAACDCFGCTSKFRLFETVGTNINYGVDENGTFVTGDSVFDARYGGHAIYLRTDADNNCCKLHAEISDFGGSNPLYCDCGTPRAEPGVFGFGHTGIVPNSSTEINALAGNHPTAFSVKWYFIS